MLVTMGCFGEDGVVVLPGGALVRGRPLARDQGTADFTLVLGRGRAPSWPHRRVAWPDFWIPIHREDTLDALHDVLARARRGEHVEVACRGGVGRTGTALAALAVLDGASAGEALQLVRAGYHPRAVETPWQRRWLIDLARGAAPHPSG